MSLLVVTQSAAAVINAWSYLCPLVFILRENSKDLNYRRVPVREVLMQLLPNPSCKK